jgi:DNA invertase Pin-like site-specific DNA recombinase
MTDTRPIRVALYARVSTSNHGQDVTLQTRELKEFVERRGWQLAGEYVDLGISGAKDRRPQLDRLMADARRREFDAVLVWKVDRFARSVSHLLRALETFQELGIDFVSLSESLDTSTPTGKMVFTVLGAVAELERSVIVERVKAGLRNARAKGKRLARPRAILDVYPISELRNAGLSWPQIARQLGCGVGTAHRAFSNLSKKAKDEALSSAGFSPLKERPRTRQRGVFGLGFSLIAGTCDFGRL